MKDSPIIILDEATANVDPENEEELIKAIEALTKEKTNLVKGIDKVKKDNIIDSRT